MASDSILTALLKGYIEQQGMEKIGPHWKEDRAARQIANATNEAQLQNLPSPEEAFQTREAARQGQYALAGYRGTQAETATGKLAVAQATQRLREADSLYKRDPTNPANKLALANAQRALAQAGLAEKRTTDPSAFFAPHTGAASRGRGIMMQGEGGRPVMWYPQTGETMEPPEQLGQADTADMRNRAKGKELAGTSINAVKELSKRVITKIGPAQRATAAVRGIEAVMGNDPEFRTYQDARMALAGNLAVAQQGSRPSDADIRAIWLPLVPDTFRDTSQSAAMKWTMIETMMGAGVHPPTPDATGGAPPPTPAPGTPLPRRQPVPGASPAAPAQAGPAAGAPPRPPGVPPEAQWDPATRRWRL